MLYQERIATFAPLPYLRDSDGREARRLEDLLGDLYEPVHFDPIGKSEEPEAGHMFRDLIRASIPLWLSHLKGRLDPASDPWLGRWVSRVGDWPDRAARLRNLYDEAVKELRQAQRALADAEAENQRVLAQVSQRRADLEPQIKVLTGQLRAERLARQEVLAPLKARRESLLRSRQGGSADAETELRAVHAELKAVSASLRDASPAWRRCAMLQSEYSLLAAQDRASAAALAAARNAMAQARDRVGRQQGYLDRPWSGERRLISWLDARRLDSRPPGLETIAFGKVYGPIFEFLANDCGLWVAEDPNRPYAGTLVGPSPVVDDIMEILAECHVATHPGWVLMSKLSAHAPLRVAQDDEAVSVVLPYVLPAPRPRPADSPAERNAYLAAVTRFRRDHETELQILRQAIEREIPIEPAPASIAEAAQVIRESMAEPLAQISRALALHRELGLRPVGVKVLRHAGHGAASIALSTAAAAIATPIVGDTIGLQSTAAAVIGGSILGFTTTMTTSAASLYRRRTIMRRVERSPYRYLYDVGASFGLRQSRDEE